MPIILKIEHKDGQRTAVWEITEDESILLNLTSLNKTDLSTLSLIPNPGRRLEWLAVRALLKESYSPSLTIDYLDNGKPVLVNHTDKISISHSGKMVSLAIHPTQNPGIDIEMVSPRIFKIAGRFLSDVEKKQLGAQPSVEQLTIIWGAKEVMFKVYGQGNISFQSNFKVNPFTVSTKGILEGVICKNTDTLSIPMEYKMLGDFILVQTDYARRNFEKKSDL